MLCAIGKEKERDGGEDEGRDDEACEIGLGAAQILCRPPRGNGGETEEQSAKQGGQHGRKWVRGVGGFVTIRLKSRISNLQAALF